MAESVIAIVFDFDETLGPDTISFFLKEQKIDPAQFWEEVNGMVQDGWDPPLAYMHKMLVLSQMDKLDISKKALEKVGKSLKLFPGLPGAFSELRDFVRLSPELKQARIGLEFYIISGGFEDLIKATKVGSHIDGILGCNFAYDKDGKAIGIKSAISFTEKTRYLHGIRKGISIEDLRTNPYKLNDAITPDMQRVPFSQMIYIGDGPSDIPCLSMVTHNGGTGIGASAPFGTFKKGYELARGKRITVGPYTANYKKGSDMRKVLEETILRVGLEIGMERRKNIINAPSH
ncbi:MAG: haloacid dehalogenase-like hydrolase [Candidatus Levybacteria bacterium]|nr:haloacid dehalogenase-like hydrolase [Candidatus Levybacteria bacterium]